MASLMEELLLTMDGESEQYEKLISLSDDKKDSIIHRKLDLLEVITLQEQEIGDKLLELEKKRAAVLKSIAQVLGREGQDITVSWLIDNLKDQPDVQRKLLQSKERLLQLASDMQVKNVQTQNLLETALELVEFDITLLKSARQAPETANYGRNATTTGSILGGSGFDAKQ